jgi:hypothetical protein
MDKLEYIPGDLVSIYVGVKKYIVEVIGTENENEALLYQIKFPNGEIQYADKDNIVPIPLTTEILEKNGWEHKDDVYFKEYPHRKLVVMDGNAYIINESCSLFLCKAEFVHELQHLLYALHIDSNLKI